MGIPRPGTGIGSIGGLKAPLERTWRVLDPPLRSPLSRLVLCLGLGIAISPCSTRNP